MSGGFGSGRSELLPIFRAFVFVIRGWEARGSLRDPPRGRMFLAPDCSFTSSPLPAPSVAISRSPKRRGEARAEGSFEILREQGIKILKCLLHSCMLLAFIARFR